jgi:hypothetical protein
MNESDRRFWPFKPRVSMISAIVLLVSLLLIVAILRETLGWPGEKSENTVLVGVLLLSFFPALLALVDVVVERGGIIEYGGVKIDLSQVPQSPIPGVTVPANIGVRGEAVMDSSTTQILDALRQATACDVVIIDLEEGQAWWETRQLVLVAGAARLKKHEKFVFVGTDAGRKQCFQGWAHAHELLRRLEQAHLQYPRCLRTARAASQTMRVGGACEPDRPCQPRRNTRTAAVDDRSACHTTRVDGI